MCCLRKAQSRPRGGEDANGRMWYCSWLKGVRVACLLLWRQQDWSSNLNRKRTEARRWVRRLVLVASKLLLIWYPPLLINRHTFAHPNCSPTSACACAPNKVIDVASLAQTHRGRRNYFIVPMFRNPRLSRSLSSTRRSRWKWFVAILTSCCTRWTRRCRGTRCTQSAPQRCWTRWTAPSMLPPQNWPHFVPSPQHILSLLFRRLLHLFKSLRKVCCEDET